MATKSQDFMTTGITIAITGLLAACASLTQPAPDAIADIGPASGSQVRGTAAFTRTPGGVHLAVKLTGLTAGEHGIHIHEIGDCSAPDATSAKGHFNPTNKPHGSQDSDHHAGDMPNLTADGHGEAEYAVDLPALVVGGGQNNIVGRAVIIHAAADDYKTQPAGNSGVRVACGVIKAGG